MKLLAPIALSTALIAQEPVHIDAALVHWEGDKMELSGGVVLRYEGARLEALQATVRYQSDLDQRVELEGSVFCHLADGTDLYCSRAQLQTGSGSGHCESDPDQPVRLQRGADTAIAQQLDFQWRDWVLTQAILRHQVHLVQASDPPLYYTADTATLDPAAGKLTLESDEPYQVLAWGGAQQMQMQASCLHAIQVEGEPPRIEAEGSVLLSLSDDQIQRLTAPFTQETS
jgi:hypothetical protein